jgi:hypothetical protein
MKAVLGQWSTNHKGRKAAKPNAADEVTPA